MEPFYIHDGVGFYNPKQKPNIPNMSKVRIKKEVQKPMEKEYTDDDLKNELDILKTVIR
tara:strand:+ start:101 stop:277 length:177 start_codon:yes stop_codon:yes gene_type:complete